MAQFIFLYLLILCTCFAREPPTVVLPNLGTLIGKEITFVRTQKIIAFLGIPYAKPPVNQLRFAPPDTNVTSWSEPRNATDYAPACYQDKDDYQKQELLFLNLTPNITFTIDEDCLYLNVFKPYGQAPPEGFATVIWFHPGNFTIGSPTMWNPSTLVFRQRIIVVTVAYRLNIFGFLSTMDGEAPGNFGLRDQQAAMKWVKNNIKEFDGNPDNICLMGYGAGAVSVGIHMVNEESREFFAKAIAMSGNFLDPSAVKISQEDKSLLDNLAYQLSCRRNPTSELIVCLRDALPMNLINALKTERNWRPLIDARLSNSSTPPMLSDLPRNLFENGDFAKVPFLTGYTNMEKVFEIKGLDIEEPVKEGQDVFFADQFAQIISRDLPSTNNSENCVYNLDHIVDAVTFFYGPSKPVDDLDAAKKVIAQCSAEKHFGAPTFLHASLISKQNVPVYMYRFDMQPNTSDVTKEFPDWMSVPHLFDLLFVWGMPFGISLGEKQWDATDKKNSDVIMSLLASFAKQSDPAKVNTYPITWDQFSPQNPAILVIDNSFNMKDSKRLNYKSFEFWNDYYPKVVAIATQCCNATDIAPHNGFSYSVFIYEIFLTLILTFMYKIIL